MKNTTSFKALAVTAVMLLCSCSKTDNRQTAIAESNVASTVSTDTAASSVIDSVPESSMPTSTANAASGSEEENMIYAHIGENVLPIELCDNNSADAFL